MRRRPLLLFVLALTLLAQGGRALASAGAATRSSPIVICPVVARAGVIIPCCGPPLMRAAAPPALKPTECCPLNPVLCTSMLTVDSKPDPSRADSGVVISGRLLGAITVGMPVQLWQRLPGESGFQKVAATTTGALGSYRITRTARQVQTDREWYVTSGTARSRTITQAVQALVTLAAVSGKLGLTILSGRVIPSHKGEGILLQRRTTHGWRTIARSRLTSVSSFTTRQSLGKGPAVLKAVLSADRINVLSTSAPLALHVR